MPRSARWNCGVLWRERSVKSRASTMTRDFFTTSSVAARAQPRSTEPSKGPTLSQDALCSVSCCSNLLAARCAARRTHCHEFATTWFAKR